MYVFELYANVVGLGQYVVNVVSSLVTVPKLDVSVGTILETGTTDDEVFSA